MIQQNSVHGLVGEPARLPMVQLLVSTGQLGGWLRRPSDLVPPFDRLPREVRPVPAVAVFPSGRGSGPDGIALCVGLSAVAAPATQVAIPSGRFRGPRRESPLRGKIAPRRTRIAFAWLPRPRRSRFRPGGVPGRTKNPFVWENRPWPDENPLCVGGAATQVAITSGRLPGPDVNPLCVEKPPTQLPIPSGLTGEGAAPQKKRRGRPVARPAPHGPGGEGMGRRDRPKRPPSRRAAACASRMRSRRGARGAGRPRRAPRSRAPQSAPGHRLLCRRA